MNDFIRLEHIEQRLSALEAEAKELRLALEQAKAEIPSDTPKVVSKETISEPFAPLQPITPPPAEPISVAEAFAEKTMPVTATPKTSTSPAAPSAPKTSSRFEDNLGGKVMGIVAAILVFIGLLLFGSVLYERLGDTARITLLFLISFAILGAGLFLERRRASRFTTALIGCGFGSIYISLFLTALYFGVLSREGLYLLLLLWYTGIGIYVFKRHSYTVALLGQLGITFSVLFGCLGADSVGLYNFLCVYSVVVSLLYLGIVLWRFLPMEKNVPLPWIYLVAAALNTLQMVSLTYKFGDLFDTTDALLSARWFAGLILCVYSFALPMFYLLRNRLQAGLPLFSCSPRCGQVSEEKLPLYRSAQTATVCYGFYQFFCTIVHFVVADYLFTGDTLQVVIFCLLELLLWLLFQLFGFSGTEGMGPGIVCAGAICITFLATFTLSVPDAIYIVIIAFTALAFSAFGFFAWEYPVIQEKNSETGRWQTVCKRRKGRLSSRFLSLVFLPVLLLYYPSGAQNEAAVFWILTLLVILFFTGTFLLVYKKENKQPPTEGYLILLFLSVMFCLFRLSYEFCDTILRVEDYHSELVVLTVMVLANSAAFYSSFRNHLGDSGKKYEGLTTLIRILHNILWFCGLSLLQDCAGTEHVFRLLWLLLLTLFLCGSGMSEQYRRYRDKTGLGVYFGIKTTFYLLIVLCAFEAVPGYVISCSLLLLAILAILAGFKLRLAPLRVYGLCLAMFAVIKLLMADLEHDNSMETVLCFLGAGALCFAINFIYNHMKKRFTDTDTTPKTM